MKVHFDKEAKGNAEMAYGTGTGNYLTVTLKGYIERRKSKGKITTKLKVNKNYSPPSFLQFTLHVYFPKHGIQQPKCCLDWRSLVCNHEMCIFPFIKPIETVYFELTSQELAK